MGWTASHAAHAAVIGALLAASALTPAGAAPADVLASGFQSPPSAARPRVWWHWMNGNVTKEGIRKDIEWMSRVGIGGLQNFDVNLLTPKVVDNRLVYMSPEWKDAFRYAATLADKKGLELAIASSPGWSETGGPWVQAQDAMKKLVWTETVVSGPGDIRLPEPPNTTGRFGDLTVEPDLLGDVNSSAPQFYRDSMVVAYRLPDDVEALPTPQATSSDGAALDASVLSARSFTGRVDAPKGTAEAPGAIILEYPHAITARSFVLALVENTDTFGGGGAGVRPRLEAQDTAGRWNAVADIDLSGTPQTTVSFPAVTASRFRVVFIPITPVSGLPWTPAPGAATVELGAHAVAKAIGVRQARLSSEAQVDRFEVKAGFGVVPSYYGLDKGLKDEPGVKVSDVIDLTGKMSPDGQLRWTAPAGRWKVLRIGYSLLGTTNHPTTKEAAGLEVDKLDAAAVRRYLETYLSNYAAAAGPDLIGKRGVRALLTDSIEVGAANWTPEMVAQFQRLRGYDPRPWLPVLTGAVIGSRAQSEAFLYDYRRTLADLLASEHYGTVAKVAHEQGLTLYGEALEDRRPMLGDDLTMRSHTDIPMAALWSYRPEEGPRMTYIGDIRGAASVAHVYGQNIVAAESMTAAFNPWAFAPHDLKRIIDTEFVSGVNRPVVHTSVHQPLDDKQPGFSLFIFGQYFNRHETWAEMAKPWVDYMARNSFMLQQGRNHADLAFFVGEERPITQLFADDALRDLPHSYAYDFISADIVRNELSVRDGQVVAKHGARYRAIYLGGDSGRMTLPVLKQLAVFVTQGATLIGQAPTMSPSLADDPKAFSELVHSLWADGLVTRVGKGQVIASSDPEAALRSVRLGPDFSYNNPDGARQVMFVHRQSPGSDIYFVTNGKDRSERFEARFRIAGRRPEIWHAETGTSEPASYKIESGVTKVPLDLKPYESVYLVFRKPTKLAAATVRQPEWRSVGAVDGGWEVTFQPGRGAPPSAHLDHLSPLNESAETGIKYFSGVATYRTHFKADALHPGEHARLDLGGVGDIAEVSVNGVKVGTAWNAPFQVDVSKALRSGDNTLEVKVADLWVNRLIGDAQPGSTKLTFTTAPTYKSNAPLRPAGLMGPVTLQTSR